MISAGTILGRQVTTSAGLDLIESERIGVQLPRNRLLGKEPLPPALFQTKEYPFHSLLA
jgi:hypothetical protein